MATESLNIHNALFRRGFELILGGMTRFQARKRYVGVQYNPEIRERLKFAKGEVGYGTLLASEKNLLPEALTLIYPTEFESEDASASDPASQSALQSAWYVALAVPKRKLIYGYERPLETPAAGQVMIRLRKSSFHAPDTDGALFYACDAPGYVTKNPYCNAYWLLSSGYFTEERRVKKKFPPIIDLISQDKWHGGADGKNLVKYVTPPVRDNGLGDPAKYQVPDKQVQQIYEAEERQRAIRRLINACPWASPDLCAIAWDEACYQIKAQGSALNGFTYESRMALAKKRLELEYGNTYQSPTYPSYGFGSITATRASDWGDSAANYRFEWLGMDRAPGKPAPPIKPEPEPELKSKTGRMVLLKDPE